MNCKQFEELVGWKENPSVLIFASEKSMYLDSVKDRFPQVQKRLIDLARIPSVTPPSDTKTIAEYVAATLSDIPGVAVSVLSEVNPIVNVLASVEGAKGAGHTLLLNGHLDTFEVVTPENWKHAPFGGEVENRRIFGVGVSDMKAGCASLLETFILMAEHRDEWAGKLILTLVGGEECGGKHGTEFLLRTIPELSRADACLIGDVGTTRVVRFGEKGRYRFKLMAHGIPGHGAHMHKTKNAIDMLIDAIVDYKARVKAIPVNCPEDVLTAIRNAGPVSESVVGAGETETLLTVTSNIGIFRAGTAPNLVPGYAEVVIDSRFPVGVKSDDVKAVLDDLCKARPGISYETMMICEALCSDPNHPLLKTLVLNARRAFNAPCVATVRLGGTDAKHVRRYGVPSFSCGCEGGFMGAPDEFVDFDELDRVFETHARSVFEYMQS